MEETFPEIEGEGAMGTAPSPRRKKSTGFPVVSLAEAAPILKQAGRYGFTHSMPAFASYMGHSTTNSGAFRQRLAAFRDWKLVSGRGDSLEMTETARAIAHPESDDAEARALQSAFMNCPVFYRLYDESAKGIPLNPDGLGSRGVLEAGVSPASKQRFVESFLASAVIAGLAEMLDDGHVLLLPFASEAAQDEQSSPSEVTVVVPPATARAEAPSPFVATPVVHKAWEIDGGSILFEIRTLKPFPPSAFAIVGDVFQNLEHLAKMLGPAETATHDTSSH